MEDGGTEQPLAQGRVPGATAVGALRPLAEVKRRNAALTATALGGLLALAAWMDPAAAGHGTHTQLGLPPCTFLTLTGLPCPMCGGTTTFALMADGRWVSGFLNQPFAAGLFVLVLAGFAVSATEAVQPRGRLDRIADQIAPYEAWFAVALLGGMGAGWLWKLVEMAR